MVYCLNNEFWEEIYKEAIAFVGVLKEGRVEILKMVLKEAC